MDREGAWFERMELDSDSTSQRDHLVTVFTTALAVTAFGTAWADPSRLWLLFIPLTFFLAAYQTGRLVESGVLAARLDGLSIPVARAPVRLGIGTAALSLVTFGTGLLGLMPLAGVLVLGLCGLAAVQLWRTGVALRPARPLLPALGAGFVAGAAWLVGWLWATTPPVFFDELSYHLVVPERALATWSLPVFPWIFFTLMPHASDVLLAWGMGLGKLLERLQLLAGGGDLGARAMVWTLWAVCSVIAWGLLRVVLWPRQSVLIAPLVTAAFAASPTLWFLATLPFAEGFAAIGVLTAAVILVASHRRDPAEGIAQPWLLYGLALGLVGTAKLTGTYWIAASLAAAGVSGWKGKDIVRAALTAGACVAPWWGRALFYTGNPIYPMAYDVLGGKFWSAESQARVMGDVSLRLGDLGPAGLIRLPWDLLRHPEQFGSGANVGLLAIVATGVVLCLPVLVRTAKGDRRHRRLADAAAVFLLLAGLGWVMTSTVTRFFSPAFLICLTVLCALVLSVRLPMQRVVAVLMLAVGLWGTSQFIAEHAAVFSSREVALGLETRDSYMARQVDHFAASRFVRESLPGQAKLLFIGETRAYYFGRDGIAPTAYDRHPLDRWVRESDSPEVLARRLRTEGITHVVLNVREFRRLTKSYGLLVFAAAGDEADEQRLKALPSRLKLLFVENGVYVFEVPGTDAIVETAESSRG